MVATPAKFPADIIAAAQAAQVKWGVPASVTLAQWALESGWGQHTPPNSFNPFGIKAAHGDPCVTCSTMEVVHGRVEMVKAPFRKFDNLAEAFDAHGRLLATAPVYAKAQAVMKDPVAFAHALTGVYATDPNYGSELVRLMTVYELAKYDAPSWNSVVASITQMFTPAPKGT